jgi:hypothetical protein
MNFFSRWIDKKFIQLTKVFDEVVFLPPMEDYAVGNEVDSALLAYELNEGVSPQ